MQTYKNSLKAFYELISTLEQLPSVGKKSATKMAYTLCVDNKYLGLNIAHALENAARYVRSCSVCNGVSESEVCEICLDDSRDNGQICIVANARDVFVLEDIGEFGGKYFVLDSNELESIDFKPLCNRIVKNNINEIIFAFSPSLANEAMMLYIEDNILNLLDSTFKATLKFSKIAQGVPTGIGLDSIDQLSLSRALSARVSL